MKVKNLHLFLLISICVILILTGINPYDRFIWFLEVLPAIIGIIVLIIIYPKFKFSNLVYILIWIHCIILIIGGYYTYAEMPLFNWLRDAYGLSRNYYDRLGHIAQGFIPVLVIREVLIRKKLVSSKRWASFIAISMCLAISASYEILEFIFAIFSEETAEAFLGTQGDIWDSQWDMICALIGSILSVIILGRYQDRVILDMEK